MQPSKPGWPASSRSAVADHRHPPVAAPRFAIRTRDVALVTVAAGLGYGFDACAVDLFGMLGRTIMADLHLTVRGLGLIGSGWSNRLAQSSRRGIVADDCWPLMARQGESSMPRSALLLAAAAMLVTAAAAAHAAPAPTGAQASPGKSAPAPGGASADVPACPGDRAVWVNPRSKAYHLQGDRMFGRTKRGKYECEAAAKAEGDHPAKGK